MLSVEEASKAFGEAFALLARRGSAEAIEEYDKILDCYGCGQQVGLIDGAGQCEWCDRRHLEKSGNSEEVILYADGKEFARVGRG